MAEANGRFGSVTMTATSRDIVVAGALPRQQVRSYLKALKVHFQEEWQNDIVGATFTVAYVTDEQWGQIQEWVRKVTG